MRCAIEELLKEYIGPHQQENQNNPVRTSQCDRFQLNHKESQTSPLPLGFSPGGVGRGQLWQCESANPSIGRVAESWKLYPSTFRAESRNSSTPILMALHLRIVPPHCPLATTHWPLPTGSVGRQYQASAHCFCRNATLFGISIIRSPSQPHSRLQ